jgi:hypothetical protein
MARLLVGGYTFVYLLKRRSMERKVVRTDPRLFDPVGPVRALSRPLPPPVADALNDATLVSTALFAAGAGHRITGPIHSALLAWTLSYRNSWSKIYHSDNTLVLHTALLAAGRASDALSVDALARGQRPVPHPRYGWPLRFMNITSAITYLLAGVAKLSGPSGWAWAEGDELRRHVAVNAIRKEVLDEPTTKLGYALYPHRRLFTGFAVGSLALELAAPIALLHRNLGRAWALAAFGMHWGIRAIMGIKFRYQQCGISFAGWFDLERILQLVRRP